MILLIDNYDSFVHNLARYLERLGQPTCVVRNDKIDPARIRLLQPAAVVISPGPCTPCQAGCSLEVVRQLGQQTAVLGICLGHQVIAEALGGRIVRAARPMHGRTSPVRHDDRGVFAGVPQPLTVCRYHSLIVEESSLPSCLQVSARGDDGVVMAIRHRELPLVGLQFHPESILTDHGYRLLANFLRLAGLESSDDGELSDQERPAPPPAARLPTIPVTF